MSNQGVQMAGSLMEELRALVKPMPGHFRIRWFEARDVIERHEAASQAERDRLQARITELEHQADERNAGYDVLFRSCEAHRERADRCEGMLVADRRAIGNLLARIFGDGGHKLAAIGGVTAACEEAEAVVLAERQALVNLWPALSDLMQDLRCKGNDTTPCDAYHEGYKLACRGIATQIRQLLAASSSGAGGAGDTAA